MRNNLSTVGFIPKTSGANNITDESKPTPTGQAASPNKGRALDGFIKKAGRPKQLTSLATKAKTGMSPLASNTAGNARLKMQATAQTVHRKAQRSKTLMRTTVAKPAAIKTKANGLFVNREIQIRAKKPSLVRQSRAKTIPKNENISRFNFLSKKSSQTARMNEQTALVKNNAARAESINTQPRPHQSKPVPSMVTSVSHHQLERLLDQALHRASSHKKTLEVASEQQSRWQKFWSRPKWQTIGSALLVVFLLGGFFAWQNIPQVSMRVAAARTNVNASIPTYTPPGFSFSGPIQYNNRAVTINFAANADQARHFSVTQETSNDTSASLAENVLADDKTVQTSQVNGTTVYIYGNQGHATWVNHGVRYTINDSAQLNTDQILKIAGGLQ